MRTYHRRVASADPDALWDAAGSLQLSDTRTLGRLVRWRIPDLDGELTYGELFRAYPFTVLEEGERYLLAGLCGRIWTLARDYPRLAGPDDFACLGRARDRARPVRALGAAGWAATPPSSSPRRASSPWTARPRCA